MQITDNTALLLVDVQQGFADAEYWGGGRNNPDAEQKCIQLLARWRELSQPIFHIQHSSTTPESRLHPSHAGFAFCEGVEVLAGEHHIVKHVNSGFIGTDLLEKLQQLTITQVVIAGLTTDHCISTTTRMAGNFGFEVLLVGDACATFDKVDHKGNVVSSDLVHQTHLASLHNEFATVCTLQDVLDAVNNK